MVSRRSTRRHAEAEADEAPELAQTDADEGGEVYADEGEHSWQLYESTREWFEAGRTDMKARGRHFNTDKYAPPTEEQLRRYPSAYFVIHHLINNVPVYADAKLVKIEPSVQTIRGQSEAPASPAPSPPPPSTATLDLDALAERVAAKISPPRSHGSEASRDDLYREMMEREREHNREVRERDRLYFEQLVTSARGVGESDDAPVDDDDRALMLLLKDERVRSRVTGGIARLVDPETAPQKSMVVEVLETAFDHADQLPVLMDGAGRFIGNLLGGIMGRPAQQQPAPRPAPMQQRAPTPQHAPQPEAAPATYEQEAGAVLSEVLDALQRDAPVRRPARHLARLFEAYPEESQQVQILLQLPGEAICQSIAAQYPHLTPVLTAEHAPGWFESLKSALEKRRNITAVEPRGEGEGGPSAEETAQAKTA